VLWVKQLEFSFMVRIVLKKIVFGHLGIMRVVPHMVLNG